jgi:hypothetical protein
MTSTEHVRGASRWWPRIIAIGVLVLAIFAAIHMSVVFMQARDAADGSCLASLHAAIDRQDWLDPGREGAAWRSWTHDEVRQALGRLGDRDCDASPDARWRRLLRVRSRKAGSVVEVQLWLEGKPGVSSPWGLRGLE